LEVDECEQCDTIVFFRQPRELIIMFMHVCLGNGIDPVCSGSRGKVAAYARPSSAPHLIDRSRRKHAADVYAGALLDVQQGLAS
jgi:hypothetical protein